MSIYSEIVKELNMFHDEKIPDKRFHINVPKLIYGILDEDNCVLVLEDLKELDFQMNCKIEGLNENKLFLAVKQLASLHALSYLYNIQKNPLTEKYPELKNLKVWENSFVYMAEPILLSVIKYLENKKGYVKQLEKLKKILPYCSSKVYAMLNSSTPKDIICLRHGDFWNNNIMFKSNGNSDDQIKLLDWQNCSLGHYIFDLEYLLFTSTTSKIKEDCIQHALEQYYNTFKNITMAFDNALNNWNLENLKKEFISFSFMGFIYGIIINAITLSESAKTIFQSKNQKQAGPLTKKFLRFGIKLFIDYKDSSIVKFVNKTNVKKMILPLVEEITSGKNEILNNRIIDIINDCDKRGIFNDI